jgi:DNA-binding response OmpR family regulator
VRLLLVEDDPAVAATIVETLELRGFDTRHVTSGAAALHEVEHGTPACDLVLLDRGLPDIDGLDVCREVRRRRRLPVIIVSGRGDEIDRVMGLELGADDYVVKPFGMSDGPTKTVDVHVASLRKKLGDGRWIETVRGIGFRLAPPR